MRVPHDNPELADAAKLHRVAIQVGGISAGIAALIFLLWALFSWDPTQLSNFAGPAALAGLCFFMIRRRWYHAELILLLAALSTVLSFKFFGGEETSTPAAIGVVVIVSIGVLFMDDRWKWHYVWLGSIGLLLVGVFWQGLTQDAIWIGISGSLSGIVAMILFIRMRDTAVALDRRYRILVEKVPMPLLEEDWSEARDWMTLRREDGVTDIDAYLEERPEELDRLTWGIKVRAGNPAILRLLSPTGEYDFNEGANHEHLMPFVRDQIIAMWEGKHPKAADYQLERTDGRKFWVRIEAVDLEPGLIAGVDRVLVGTDVSELKATQEELSEQIRSKDEFIAAVSHELRTPLTTVLGFAELMADSASGLSADQSEMLVHLRGQANDMAHIVEDLLVAARSEIGTVAVDLRKLDLAAIVRESIEGGQGRFDTHFHAEPVVVADRVRIAQIVRNLATNAYRYGGTERSVHVRTIGPVAVVEVRDNGTGIPFEQQERIFEPYTRAHDRPGTTASVGLGLAVARQLAELMGGDVEYGREDGESVFRLTLPLAKRTSSVPAH
jgi:signal transduction histidine kinase